MSVCVRRLLAAIDEVRRFSAILITLGITANRTGRE